ncbi:MAG: nucleotidyltransferase domain-containing protein [Candidatus Atribacteria bacterium]|nr:nucleotidyltransferase domain-containing protein [Candidatus Atribacteria bacterium]
MADISSDPVVHLKPRGQKQHTRLPRPVQRTLNEFQRRALALFPGEISQIILYGSYASGEAEPDSDVDVMVVGRWPTSKRYLGGPGDARWRKLVNAAMDSMVTGGPFLSVLVVGEDLFNSGFPVAEEARQEGRFLWTNQQT